MKSKMSNEEILRVVKAHSEGKRIEYRAHTRDPWTPCRDNKPVWDFYSTEYRVRETIEEFEVHKPDLSDPYWHFHDPDLCAISLSQALTWGYCFVYASGNCSTFVALVSPDGSAEYPVKVRRVQLT